MSPRSVPPSVPTCVPRGARGFTMIEVAVVAAIFGLVLVLFGRTFVTSNALAATSRASLQSNDDLRRSLDRIADLLRGAEYGTLTGFDADGKSTCPCYCCATGSNASGIVLDVPETLSWRAVSRTYNGISNPGEVVVTKNGVSTVVAPYVPSGGFSVQMVGNTLRISLTSFSSTSQRTVSTCTCTTYVSLRN